jgi:hypothetical protein
VAADSDQAVSFIYFLVNSKVHNLETLEQRFQVGYS